MTPTALYRLSAAAIAAVLITGATRADTRTVIDIGVYNTMSQFFADDEANRELAAKAAGILVFPRVRREVTGNAGGCGDGALLVDGHPVAYYSMGAASVGATASAGQHSEVILFMTPGALEAFRRSQRWIVGTSARVAVVSRGSGAQYDSKTLHEPILAFLIGGKGLIVDRSIDGTRISIKTS